MTDLTHEEFIEKVIDEYMSKFTPELFPLIPYEAETEIRKFIQMKQAYDKVINQEITKKQFDLSINLLKSAVGSGL